MTSRRLMLATAGSIMVVAAAVVVAWGAVTTSTARLNATTTGSGSFVAGTIDLAQVGSAVSLLFDADGLYAGQIIPSCVVIDYDGSVPAQIRLHAASTGGTGLEDYVDFRLWVFDDGACPADGQTDSSSTDRRASEPLHFDGLLGDLWRTHGDFANGLELTAMAEPGDRLVIEAEVELLDDEAAQGRTTEFSLVLEARP